MRKTSSISILITYFNEQSLLTRCLHSLERQTLLPYKVYIYDDASNFKAADYVTPSDYSFDIEIIRNIENKGPAYGRNLLMNVSKTDFFRFQDADDEMFENALFEIQNVIDQYNSDIVLNEVTSYNEEGIMISERVVGLSDSIIDIFDFSLTHSLLIPSITYKRALASSIGGFKERDVLPQSEDADFNRRISLQTNNFYFIGKSLVKQNIRLSSHSSKNYDDVWTSNLKSLFDLEKEINKKYLPKYFEALLKTGIQLYHQKNYISAMIAFKAYENSNYGNYANYGIIKRFIAKIFGPMTAEDISKLYRNLLPQKIRQVLKKF